MEIGLQSGHTVTQSGAVDYGGRLDVRREELEDRHRKCGSTDIDAILPVETGELSYRAVAVCPVEAEVGSVGSRVLVGQLDQVVLDLQVDGVDRRQGTLNGQVAGYVDVLDVQVGRGGNNVAAEDDDVTGYVGVAVDRQGRCGSRVVDTDVAGSHDVEGGADRGHVRGRRQVRRSDSDRVDYRAVGSEGSADVRRRGSVEGRGVYLTGNVHCGSVDQRRVGGEGSAGR